MKTKAYLRVSMDKRSQTKIVATSKPSHSPIMDPRGNPLPTVGFAIELDIPNAMFNQAAHVIASLTIPESSAQIAADVKVVES